MPKRKTVAEKLRDVVNANPETDASLADASGLHESTLSRFRRGECNLQMDKAERLARALGCEIRLIRK